MKILAISDLHLDAHAAEALVAAAGPADLVIGAGDFADKRQGLEAFMARLAPIADRMIVVPGNNESLDELRAATGATVLHGDRVTWQGRVVAGIGAGIPPKPGGDWPSWDLDEAAARDLLDGIPEADILISHSPPAGLGDNHSSEGRIGSHSVKSALMRLAPKLCVFGHVHDCWGDAGRLGPTEWRNLGPRPVWFEI